MEVDSSPTLKENKRVKRVLKMRTFDQRRSMQVEAPAIPLIESSSKQLSKMKVQSYILKRKIDDAVPYMIQNQSIDNENSFLSSLNRRLIGPREGSRGKMLNRSLVGECNDYEAHKQSKKRRINIIAKLGQNTLARLNTNSLQQQISLGLLHGLKIDSSRYKKEGYRPNALVYKKFDDSDLEQYVIDFKKRSLSINNNDHMQAGERQTNYQSSIQSLRKSHQGLIVPHKIYFKQQEYLASQQERSLQKFEKVQEDWRKQMQFASKVNKESVINYQEKYLENLQRLNSQKTEQSLRVTNLNFFYQLRNSSIDPQTIDKGHKRFNSVSFDGRENKDHFQNLGGRWVAAAPTYKDEQVHRPFALTNQPSLKRSFKTEASESLNKQLLRESDFAVKGRNKFRDELDACRKINPINRFLVQQQKTHFEQDDSEAQEETIAQQYDSNYS